MSKINVKEWQNVLLFDLSRSYWPRFRWLSCFYIHNLKGLCQIVTKCAISSSHFILTALTFKSTVDPIIIWILSCWETVYTNISKSYNCVCHWNCLMPDREVHSWQRCPPNRGSTVICPHAWVECQDRHFGWLDIINLLEAFLMEDWHDHWYNNRKWL
jgi:hypothetical protein